jgi:hypothetical protein
MFKLYRLPGAKVHELAVSQSKEGAAQVLREHFSGQEIPIEKIEDFTPREVETDEGIIVWSEYQTRFHKPLYWGYFNPKRNEFIRIIWE